MASNILVCDLARPRDRGLAAQLVQCGYFVEVAATTEEAYALLRKRLFACVLIRVEDAQGVELCTSLRAGVIPIVVACATRDEALIVRYLRIGAERVITGPLSRRDLGARLGATLSAPDRVQRRTAAGATCRVGDLFIDAPRHQVTRNGQFVSLTPTEFKLLAALAQRAGSVVSHRELLSEVWGDQYAEGRHVLRHYVGYLRHKLGDNAQQPRLIHNKRGVGYRLAEDAA